jgi:tetratricopeptide (TPR) repeat protein
MLKLKIFKEIVEIQPDTNNYTNLGTAYREHGEIKKSYICFTKALECDPDNDTGAFFNLSASKLHQPNEEVLIEFEKKLKLSKNLYHSDKASAIAFALYNNYNN